MKEFQGFAHQLKNAKGIPRSQSGFTGEEKFVSAHRGEKTRLEDFLALFPTGLGKV